MNAPMDWMDLPQRLRDAQDRNRRLEIEVEALRAVVIEQALELQRLKHGEPVSVGGADKVQERVGGVHA
jgi:hypothetical protein